MSLTNGALLVSSTTFIGLPDYVSFDSADTNLVGVTSLEILAVSTLFCILIKFKNIIKFIIEFY